MSEMIPAWVDGRLVPVDKLEVHRRDLPHPAVSVFVLDGERTLLQRRAAGKYHSGGLWANACCTHPRWGEAAEACAARRLREELGIEGVELRWRGRVDYRAAVGGGMRENERVEVFVAEAPPGVAVGPGPRGGRRAALGGAAGAAGRDRGAPGDFAPWLRAYLGPDAGLFG